MNSINNRNYNYIDKKFLWNNIKLGTPRIFSWQIKVKFFRKKQKFQNIIQFSIQINRQKQENSTNIGYQLPKYFGIDVEYTHLYIKKQKEQVIFASHVCLVDKSGIIYESYINPDLKIQNETIGGVGGVKISKIQNAPHLNQIQHDIYKIISGHVLVGHSLEKDMEALGLQHPPEMCRNTINYKKFQNRGGNSRSLKKLAQKHLKCQIQSGRHNPCEDAQTALNLYLDQILPFNSQLSEQEMTEKYFIQIMQEVNKRQKYE